MWIINPTTAGGSQLFTYFCTDGSGDIVGYGILNSYTGTINSSMNDQSAFLFTPEPASNGCSCSRVPG